MGGSFSSSSSSSSKKAAVRKAPPRGTVTDIDRAVLDLKNARDRLQKYRTKLSRDEERLLVRAKESRDKGHKPTALGLLRLRRYKLSEVESVENQLLTIHQMIQTVDSKQNEAQILQAMRTGKDALSKLHQETTVDDVLDLMDQIQEQAEVEAEISTILSGVPDLSATDEADVEAELAALEAELAADGQIDLPEVPTTKPEGEQIDLPAVPTTKPEIKEPARVAVAS